MISEDKRTLFLGGASFSPDEIRRLSVSSLGSNILCTRHNSALSPLDTEMARFFSDLSSITQKDQDSTRHIAAKIWSDGCSKL
jgi:hypothetical protein